MTIQPADDAAPPRLLVVICASNAVEGGGRASPHLTVGAAYHAEPAGEGWLRVWDDRGEDSLYPAGLFKHAFDA